MPDFNDLIQQAKKMQEKMKETQEILKKIEVEGISGGNSEPKSGDQSEDKLSSPVPPPFAPAFGIPFSKSK